MYIYIPIIIWSIICISYDIWVHQKADWKRDSTPLCGVFFSRSISGAFCPIGHREFMISGWPVQGPQNPQFSSLGSICADESFLDTFWECNIFHEIVDQQTNNTSWANYNDLTVLKMGWWALFQVSELLQFSQIQCQSKWLASHPQKISELRRCFRFGCASQLLSG